MIFKTKKIFHSRDIVVQESVFPFHNAPASQASDVGDPNFDILFPAPTGDFHHDPPLHTTTPSEQSQQPSIDSPLVSNSSSQVDSNNSPIVSPHTSITSSLPLRKSTRAKGPPTWLKDFVCMPQALRQSTATTPLPTPSKPTPTSSPSHSFNAQQTLSNLIPCSVLMI